MRTKSLSEKGKIPGTRALAPAYLSTYRTGSKDEDRDVGALEVGYPLFIARQQHSFHGDQLKLMNPQTIVQRSAGILLIKHSNQLVVAATLLIASAAIALGADVPAPTHSRPFFMPEARRQKILNLIEEEAWAIKAHQETRVAAEQIHAKWAGREGGFWAAFLYAIHRDPKYLELAQEWLSKGWGREAPETIRKKKLLETPENWRGPENSVDWYLLDYEAYVAFDWLYPGLPEQVRQDIHDGLATQIRYRMACMDSWGSTPNLNFKPISMIALGALALQDKEIVQWAFTRTGRQGNYVSMLDQMIRGGGPWHEAPIYAIAHKSLWCMSMVAFYGQLFNGRDWFAEQLPSGGSPQALMDYYVDTAYPMERAGPGARRIRLATYGDGSTGIKGGTSDHFLSDLADELALAYAMTGDHRYAAFLQMDGNYEPNLWDRPPLPDGPAAFPAAASRIWPVFGLAMLRSDASPEYWNHPNAIAVLQVMTQGYGHDHRDKFGITLFGANRLLYPDYLGIQYELFAMGWTNTPVCHNTMMVDDQDTANAPAHIRHDFTPDVKFLATSSEGVFEGVRQTRALLLTGEYLIDLFAAASKVPHTYDYILNSLGMPEPGRGADLPSNDVLSPRFWALEETRSGASSGPWSLDFVYREPGDDHEAKVRVHMAAENDTKIGCGTWGPGKFVERARLIHGERDLRDRWSRDGPQKLGMLVARREGCRNTVFVSTHEPYANEAKPTVRSIAKVAETNDAMVVRIEADGFTDYAAVAWGDDAESQHVLATNDKISQVFAFRNYGYLRLTSDGRVIARGGWTGLRLARTSDSPQLLLNGDEEKLRVEEQSLRWGQLSEPQPLVTDPENPFPLTPVPPLVRLSSSGPSQVLIQLTNSLNQPVTGSLELDLPGGISSESQRVSFGPVRPEQTIAVPLSVAVAASIPNGRRTIPYRLIYRVGDGEEVRTQYIALPVVVGTSILADRTRGEVVVDTTGYTARINSQSLEQNFFADPDGNVRVAGRPLYTISDEQGNQVVPVQPTGQAWLDATSITTGAGLLVRFRTEYRPSRIELPYATKAYTRMTTAKFHIPNHWLSPAGPARWKRVVAVDTQGREYDTEPGRQVTVAAAELEFPDSSWNVAIAFTPPRQVEFEGLEVSFSIPIRESETWSIGFCRPGALDQWRGGGEPKRD